AHWLFRLPWDRLAAVLHPQALVHAMVTFRDGSSLLQAAAADMALPIQLALSWPERWCAPLPGLAPETLRGLEFSPILPGRHPAYDLALAAGWRTRERVVSLAAEKCVSLAEAARRVAAWRAAGERVALASGVFDLLHVGHARHLAAARALGHRLVVGVTDDRAAAALEGPGGPVLSASDRSRLVAALRSVDLVVVFEEPAA